MAMARVVTRAVRPLAWARPSIATVRLARAPTASATVGRLLPAASVTAAFHPPQRWYAAGRSGGDEDDHDDDRKREREDDRSWRSRREADRQRWAGVRRSASDYAHRGASAIISGIGYLFDLRGHTERVLLRTGLVKDRDAASYIGTTVAVSAWTALGLTAAGTLGIDTKPLLAGVGITGFTVGFALKDIASNYLSGAFLLMNRPFRPGMVVTVGDPNKKVRGVYVKMDLRYLYLKSDRDGPDADTIILVPNSVVFASDISVSQPKSASGGNGKDNGGKSTLDQITQG